MTGRIGAADIPREITAGVVGSFLALAYCFSYAALIFSGPLSPHLAAGVASALIACAAVAIPVALFGGFSVALASPVGHTAAPLAALMAALAPVFARQPPDEALALALAAVTATTLLTAAALYALGWRRLGMLARFIPYPVMTGFLAATGWLIAAGALRIAANGQVDFFAPAMPAAATAVTIALVVLYAAALWLLSEWLGHYLVLPVALTVAALAAHFGLVLLGIGQEEARAAGFLFDPGGGSASGALPFDGALLKVDWLLLPLAGNMVAVALMAVISVLLNSAGMEIAERVDADLDRQLKVHGAANALSGALGGMVAHISLSNTMVSRAAGGRTRISGVVVGLVALAVLFGGSNILGQIPVFLLCGLLLHIGAKLLWDWGWIVRRHLPVRDWLVVLAIVAIAAVFGFVQGILFGLVASCVIFALDVSRIGVIRQQFALNERPSMVVRSESESRAIAAHGHRVRTLRLDGFIFFGSAYRLQQRVKELIDSDKPHTIVFDFTGCTGFDSSAVASFSRLRMHMRQAGVREVLAGMSPPVAKLLDAGGAASESFPNLDHALEACERRLLAEHLPHAGVTRGLTEWLAEALGGQEKADKLVLRLRPAPLLEGGYLCRQGDPTDSLLFIESGRVGVFVERPDREPLRVRVFAPHTIAGEIGFFQHAPRTASMRAEPDAKVWSLDRRDFDELTESEPRLAAALLAYIGRLQAERLAFATRQIAALQAHSAP